MEEGKFKVCHYWEYPPSYGHKKLLSQDWSEGLTNDEDLRSFEETLQKRYIQIQTGVDKLRWGYKLKGTFSIKEAYDIQTRSEEGGEVIWQKIWEMNLSPKTFIFCWLVIRKRILMV